MKTPITLLFILVLSFTCFAQDDKSKADKKARPDFSGTWILDKEKSTKVDYDLSITVVQQEPEMKVTASYDSKGKKQTERRIYYTDGRTLTNRRENSELATQETNWKKNRLVTKTSVGAKSPNYDRTMMARERTEIWELSKDGAILTIKTTEVEPTQLPEPNRRTQLGQDVSVNLGSVVELKFKRSK